MLWIFWGNECCDFSTARGSLGKHNGAKVVKHWACLGFGQAQWRESGETFE